MVEILYREETREFHLYNERISYIFSVLDNGQLGHIHFGKRLRPSVSFQHFHEIQMRSLCHTVYAFEQDYGFTMETLCQEYPSYGTGDYREPAFQVEQENGSRISCFSYQSHVIYDGKAKLPGLPGAYADGEGDAKTLEVTLEDSLAGARLILSYTIYEGYDVICRNARFENAGTQKLKLNRAMSMSVDFFDDDFEMIQLDGAWGRERHVTRRPIGQGIQSVSSLRGESSAEHNPAIVLKRPDATELQGEAYGFCLVYSGNFLAQVEVGRFSSTRVTLGIHPMEFTWNLDPGTHFQTPEAVMSYSDQGLNGMSQTFHHFFGERLIQKQWRNYERPILINNWEATYFKFDEAKILEIAQKAADLGVELFVLDDGWFGKRDDAATSLGDWYSDKAKLPEGVEGLSKKITAMGLQFGLWFEPEMVNKRSCMYEEHPEWAIETPGRFMSLGRNQYVLDYSNPEVVDYLHQMMAKILRESEISYVKWDMNRTISEAFGASLDAAHQGEFFHRYILGVYDLYERLIGEFPHILFESCASGGARFDAGLLYYAPQCWASDDTDAVERIKIQYGTSMFYPISSIGAHVSASPNHQIFRKTDLSVRGHVAYFGAFGYELDPTALSPEDQEEIREQILFYKKYRKLIQYGDFYRLKSPFENRGDGAWMVVSPDKKQACLAYFKVLANPNPKVQRLRLAGLQEDWKYRCSRNGEVAYGDELMYAGWLPDMEFTGSNVRDSRVIRKNSGSDMGDFTSQLYILEQVEE